MENSAKSKVLVVENNQLFVKNLRKYLQAMENTIIVDYAKTAQDGLNILRSEEKDVVLVGEYLPDINGLKFTELIRQDNPGTQVIVLSEEKQVDAVLKAIRSGALDFLTYDVSFEELNNAIIRAGEAALTERKKLFPYISGTKKHEGKETEEQVAGNVIAVYSPRGGSGVSTLTANLSLALRDVNYNVALVDSDLQYGDVALLFNEISRFSLLNLAPRVDDLDTRLIEDVMIHHKSSGLFILSAPQKIDLSETIDGEKICRILDFMRPMYRYIVVNTQPNLNENSLAALDTSDIIVLVMTQEITAIKAVRSFLDLWEGLKLNKDHIILVINHYDKENPLTPKKISDSLKIPVSLTIPEDRATMVKMANLGSPVLLSDKNLPISQSILQVADIVKTRLNEVRNNARTRLFNSIRM
jgi:pilus assembly protein CpaE